MFDDFYISVRFYSGDGYREAFLWFFFLHLMRFFCGMEIYTVLFIFFHYLNFAPNICANQQRGHAVH